MKSGAGKGKGAAFEREVCVVLSRWLSKGTREDLFWRSAMSGGRATVRYARGKKTDTQAGDISAIDPLGHRLTDQYYIECKFYRDLGLPTLLLRGTGMLLQFWQVASREAAKYEKKPMLIAHQNLFPSFVVLPNPRRTIGASLPFAAVLPQHGCALVLLRDMVEREPFV